ncbi:TetR/AcrR family transcriptional regulator [Novosphingobium colocasiae]|uniref:HTH tetR-type domain-containing protein n=1 Tax=Novosphingobium colocasiae TaxID=1256513 RepID=A0A918PBK6_9SPHN|nr:TetR/AcrR family transcriptional regulator [Novosphingobium colocasiae]GGY94543.1 hypothetical protein GCM10011614_06970 [Novosphingobium colocasiae]
MSEPSPGRSVPASAGEEPRRGPGRPSISNEALLDKALELFLDHGFAGTSIDAITQSASMAKRTIYARYGDKASLFRAAVAHGLDRFKPTFDRLSALEADDMDETMDRIADAIVASVVSPDSIRLLRLIRSDAGAVPEIVGDFSDRTLDPVTAFLADLFRRRTALGQAAVEDSRLVAELFIDVIARGPCSKAAADLVFAPDYVERHTRFAVKLFLHGLMTIGDGPDGHSGARTELCG